jgi:hypothetical protein
VNKSCSNCEALYYGQIPGQAGVIGNQCRRQPAQLLIVPKGVDLQGNMSFSVDSFWPVVNLKDGSDPGCCEWLPKDPKFIGARDQGLDS